MTSSGEKGYRLEEIVQRFGGELIGDPGVRIRQVASLESAQPQHLSFFTLKAYRRQLQETHAGAVILGHDARDATPLPRIVCDNPYAYFARVSALFNPQSVPAPGTHPSAAVDASARVAASASVGPFVHIGAHAQIGDDVVIGAGCAIGERVAVGAGSRLYPNVVIYDGCSIGEKVILHSGVVIGADGFGIAFDEKRWIKVPQIGAVVIGDEVEIGANTTVDRGAVDDTVIERGAKLDNQIQVGHNVRIGEHTAIAGCVGIAGSAKIGAYCKIGGAARILGHLTVADHVDISAGTLITKSIEKAGQYTAAYPFESHRGWLRNAAHLRHLDSLVARLRQLEAKLARPQRKKN
jgi:UDP-3-O-[3-hydroxymyristoyl] glucosamine N-acyltransferase